MKEPWNRHWDNRTKLPPVQQQVVQTGKGGTGRSGRRYVSSLSKNKGKSPPKDYHRNTSYTPKDTSPIAKTKRRYRQKNLRTQDIKTVWDEQLWADVKVLGHKVLGDSGGIVDIHICSYNVNSITDEKFSVILSVMKRLNIDVFVCVDTRHRESSSRRFTKAAKHVLGDGAKVLHSPIASHLTSRNKYHTSVGGQMIVIAPSWAPTLVDHYIDPTKFGLVSGVTLSTQLGQLLILGNY